MTEPRVDAHTALLRSRWGRSLIGLAVAIGALWIVGPNMPASPMRAQVDTLWRPAELIGLEQSWGVFSPNPRNQSLDVRARVEHDDGTIEFWDVPDHEPIVGATREYRWQKWQERVRLDENEALWDPTAEWIAREFERDGVAPRRVELVRRWIDHGPLTEDGTVDDGWNEFRFHVWERDG